MKDRKKKGNSGGNRPSDVVPGGPAPKLGSEPGEINGVDNPIHFLSIAAGTVGEGMCIADPSGRIKFANSALERMLGYDSEELEGESLVVLYPGKDTGSKLQEMIDALGKGGWSRKVALRTKKGGEVQSHETGSAIWDSAGDLIGYVCTNVEVGGRQRTKEELVRLGSIVESSDDAIVGLSLDGVILSWNPGAERVYGYSADEIVGRPLDVLKPPYRPHELAEQVGRIRQGESVIQYEFVDQTKDGRLIDVSATISPIRDLTGNLTGVSSIVRDITDRKRAEEELRLRTTEQEALFEIARILALPGNFHEKVSQVLQQLTQAVDADVAVVRMVDEDEEGLRLVACVPLDYESATMVSVIPLEGTLSGQSYKTGEPIVVNDYQNHPQAMPLFRERGWGSSVFLPIKAEGRALGLISVNSYEANHFTPERVRLLTAICGEIGVLLDHARLIESEHLRTQELDSLFKIARILSGHASFEEKAPRVLDEVVRVAEADVVALRVPDEERGGLRLVTLAPQDYKGPITRSIIPFEKSLSGRSFRGGEPIVLNDYQKHPQALPESLEQGVRAVLLLPIKAEDRALGLISVYSFNVNHFTLERVRLLTAISDGIGVLLENAHLHEEIQKALRQQTALLEASRSISASLDLPTVLHRIAEELCRVLDVTSVYIGDWNPEAEATTILAEYLSPNASAKERVSDLGVTYDMRRDFPASMRGIEAGSVEISHVDDPDLVPTERDHLRQFGAKSTLSIPLKVGGRVIGYAEVWESRRRREFTQDEIALVQSIAQHAGNVLEKAQLFQQVRESQEEEQERARELETLFNIAAILAGAESFEEQATDVMEQIVESVQVEEADLGMSNDGGQTWRTVASARLTGQGLLRIANYSYREGLTSLSVQQEEPQVANDYPNHPLAMAHLVEQGVSSLAALPIKVSGQFLGIVTVYSKAAGHFTPKRVSLLEAIANGMGTFLENARLFQQIKQSQVEEQYRAQELETLFNIAEILAGAESFEEQATGVMEQIVESVQVTGAYLGMSDDGGQTWRTIASVHTPGQGFPDTDNPYRGGITGLSIHQQERQVANDYPNHPLAMAHLVEQGVRSLAALPIKVSGRFLGIVTVYSKAAGHFTPKRVSLLEAIANGMGTFLEKARLFQQVKESQEEEQERARELGAVVDISPACLVLLNRDMTVRWINRSASSFFGLEPSDMIGRSWHALPSTREYRRMHKRCLAGESIDIDGERYEFDGGVRYFDYRYRPLTDAEDNVTGILIVLINVTERVLQEERLREASRLASIGELAAGVAHELNNPLTSVIGFSELLGSRALPDPAKGYVKRILDGAQRSAKIVQNLSSFARRRSPDKAPADIGKVVHATLDLKSHDLQTNEIEVVTEIESDLPRTMVDEHQMQQVFLNIITNAEQAMSGIDGKKVLKIKLWRQEEEIQISFTDNGPGIPEDILPKIFDPFFSTKEVGKGTGLGLSICYGMVQEHGGRIWADGSATGGATIHLAIPLTELVAPGAGHHDPDIGPLHKGRVLVVDDDPGIRELIAEWLSDEDLSVAQASDGRQAQGKIETAAYNCILLDLKMPGLNGIELYRWMERRAPHLTDTVVFITGDTVTPETNKFLRQVGKPVLVKPFAPASLKQELGKVLVRTGAG